MIAHIPTRMKQISIFLLAALLLYASISPAAAQPEGWMARIASAQGEVDVRRSGSLTWEPARMGDPIFPGDMLRVGQRSRAAVVLSNDTVMRLDQNTTLTFPGWEREEMSIIEIIRGAVHFFSRVLNQLKIKTPFVNGAVEGTEFLVRVERDRTTFTTFEGSVRLENARGELFVGKGQRATAAEGEPPRARIPVRARDALSWAIHYPPIIDFRPGDFRHLADPGVAASVSESIAAYRKGDIRRAFEALETVPPYIDDPYLWLYRAGLLLTVGRVAEADVYIQKTFEYQPDSVMALALNAVVAVAQGERETALELARRAVGINPDAAMARVAETYALQANFKVEDALESARTATSLNPDNPLAWALVSELYLATGWVGKALEAARRAVDINPDLSRTQTVLGFAHLTNFNTTDAIAAFTVAIARDQGDPLPRLGLGLATIRVGKLIEGRRHIEVAVALDPTNALLRSYLGKAYFEERRAEKALKQLEMAQEMDPADPTGWFYSAIVKQSVNRPVEALHDFQKAVGLNDNRAVYRSRLLLDSDLAARSASLGRIYNDLGFQQAGLVEGWRSVNTDPSNYSAHRLLADLYAALPRHQVARISELLQSQLLQPINITPVQPALAEKNLFILEGAGPTDPSFNEFNPLIVRNRFGVQASGVVGDKNTAGGEVIQSTVWNRFSYSLGAFNFRTDGFRVNNDLDQDVFNAFGQAAVSYKTSVQAEYRSRRTKNGDLPLRFDPENFSDNRRENENIQNLRVGFRHAFSPSSDTLLSLIYGDGNSGTNVQNPIFGVDQSTENDDYMAELQHIFRSASYSLVVGGGWFDGDRRTVSKTRFFIPLPPPDPTITEDDLNHGNVYAYYLLQTSPRWTWTLGASGDFFKGVINRDQFNPKLGVTYTFDTGTTVRAAGFRGLKRSLISSQTLEPTQVAGFNQLYDDPEGTDTWRYGMALDQTFTKDLRGGVEFSRRELTVPYRFVAVGSPPEVRFSGWGEQFARAYLYWALHKRWALTAEYLFESFDREQALPGEEQIIKAKTHRVPFGLNFFHPSGFQTLLKATYVAQEGNFLDASFSPFSDSDSFWVVDAAIGYRLPKRHGIITIEAKNLLDKTFQFQDTNPGNPLIQPSRMVLGKFTLSF